MAHKKPELPALPEPDTHCFDDDTGLDVWSHSADQMRAYGDACVAAAVLAERERCIACIETYKVPVGNSRAGELAAEWTMDALRDLRDAISAEPKETRGTPQPVKPRD